MTIKTELLKRFIADAVCQNFEYFTDFDENLIASTTAIKALAEIQAILKEDISDFDTVEKIVCVFEKYKINAGSCHDFC